MLKHFWALPAVLRVAVAAHSSFNVYNDLLAFPQYEVVFSKTFISGDEADALSSQKHANHVPSLHSNADDTASTLDTAGDLSLRSNINEASTPHPPSDRDTYERLVLNSRPHLCTIPHVAPSTDNTTALPKEEEEQELARAADHGIELLKDMQGQCIYYAAGWWVYSFCYNEGIRQFHPLPSGRGGVPIFPPIEDRSVQSYTLGQFPTEDKAQSGNTDLSTSSSTTARGSTNLSVTSRADSTFLSQSLTGGTICDLTSKPRRVDIHYHCNPSTNDRIAMIKETASCVYLMVIHTPRLCNDVVFQPPQLEKPHPIICREIISTEEEEREWHERAMYEAEQVLRDEVAKVETMRAGGPIKDGRDTTAKLQPQQEVPLVIGGIAVGARHVTGDTPISPSNLILAAQKQQQQALQNHLAQPNPNPNTNTNTKTPPSNAKSDDDDAQAETYIATLAKSDGKYTSSLTEPEIKRLGLRGTRQELEKWISEMDDLAGAGVPWRLDVVRLADGGMEFRGIVMEENQATWGKDAEKGKEEKKAKDGEGNTGEERGKVSDGVGAEHEQEHEGDEVGSEEEYR